MPSVFDRRFKRSGFPGLLTQFGEPIVYHFRAGGSRSINAIINRDPPATYNVAGEVIMPSFEIRVIADCKTGVLSSEVDTGGDEVELRGDVSDATFKTCSILKKESDDSGVVVLLLR